ncbi:MAG: Undecaprenyl-diphosphatase 2 [Clostridium butyricum DORA_1]|nr:MAG: Undecaprenyl-diphosphatase 2 [Clostridium butyricum DORA_1]MDU1506972.1 undecaprenyl-diphosphate phosphatase [Clostridium butyricum]MDU4799522.1 undecaprenyl-diphosphate phosphatase [Clostridium butyricum]
MEFLEIIKAIILGIVEGITEWLPISSTGHMILVDQFLKLNVSKDFMDMFLVVIQLGAILAVIVLYWEKIFPFKFSNGIKIEKDTVIMWVKIVIACIPAAVIGLLFDDQLNELFYNPTTVAVMLILFGILFIVIENYNKGKRSKINSLSEITYNVAIMIGLFQLIAAVFPGTSRSGATIVGALLIGVSRTVAAEFTFFLAIPVMFGASALKLLKFGLATGFTMTGNELSILLVGMIVAFIVSILAIKFLMSYIKNNNFKAFGWYRIILGIIVIGYFYLIK